jgi:hypothetical protein
MSAVELTYAGAPLSVPERGGASFLVGFSIDEVMLQVELALRVNVDGSFRLTRWR